VAFVTEDERDAAAYAADIEAARDRLIAFASGCSETQWRAAPLEGDPRPVAVVVDHVAEHAAAAAAVSQVDAAEHLRRSGAAISALIASLSAGELAAGDGRIRLFAQIAIRHADNHRTDIETALAAQGLRSA
jgi:hypothetical protein